MLVKVLFFIVLFIILVLCLYLLLLSFEQFFQSSEYAYSLLETLSSPFYTIILGVILTALLQSSSIAITIIALMVAAGLPFESGIFFVLGANVGTSIRSSLIKTLPECGVCDYRRMTNTSSLNYFNNMIAFGLFFPLQITTDYLGRLSLFSVNWLTQTSHVWTPVSEPFVNWTLFSHIGPQISNDAIVNLVVFLMITVVLMKFFIISLRLIFDPLIARILNKRIRANQLGKNKNKVLLTGIWTSLVLQSSSSVIYNIMPVARNTQCSTTCFYPLILGINVGTCSTTLLFAIILNSPMALAIGLTHLFYNLGAMVLFGYMPLIKELPMLASHILAIEACEEEYSKPKEAITIDIVYYPILNKHSD